MTRKHHGLVWVTGLSLVLLLGAGCSRASRKARYLERANNYFETEAYDKAEIEYLNVLRLDPQNPVAVRRLGLAYFEQGRLTAAYAFLRKAERLQPDNLDARLKLGFTCLNLSGFKEARDEAIYILQNQPTNEEALFLLVETSATPGDLDDTRQRIQRLAPQIENGAGFHLASGFLHLRRQDLTNAESEVRKAISLAPTSSAAHQVLGNLYLSRNDLKQAESAFKIASELAPIRSFRRLKYADFKIQTGDLESGKQALEEITKKAPDYVPAWTRLAETAFRQKKYDDCDKLIKRVLVKDGINYEALVLSGRVRLVKGEAARAVTEFQRISSVYPRSPQVKYQLAVSQLLNKDPARAAASLHDAIVLDPNYADAILLSAQINLRKGEIMSVLSPLTQLIKQQPRLMQAHVLLADAYRVQGNLDDALAVYRRLLELYPKNPQAPTLMGFVLLQQRKKAEARKAFEKSLELAPDYLPALEQLVGLDVAEKQYVDALQRVHEQIEKNPKAPELQFLSATVYEAKGEMNQAEAALLKAIDLQPDYRLAYLLLARIYVASNRQQSALEKLQSVLIKHPDDVTTLMQIGMIQSAMRNFAAARDTYEKLLAINPQFSPALNNLAYLYSERLGQIDKAFGMARRAHDLLPNDPYSADTLGWILYKRGEYSWALNLLEESVDRLPAEPEIQFHLGMAHYTMDEEGPARIALQRALQSNKEFVGKEEAERCLAVLAVDVKTADAKVVAQLDKRLAEQAEDPVALARLAAIREREGAFEKARDLYERALKQNPKNVSATVKLARLYTGPGNAKKALELAKSARSLAPEDANVAHTLGRLVYDQGDFKWAFDLLQESARKLPNDPEVLCDLAWSQYSLGRTAEAEATMQNALQAGAAFSRSDEARRFLSFSSLYNHPAKAQQAALQIQEILKSDPSYVPAMMAAATIHEQQGNANGARQVYERILLRYPLFAPADKLLAMLLVERLGDYQKAYEPALKAREAFPDDPEVAKILGIIVYQRADFKRAAQWLQESARKRTSDAEVFYYLGMAHYRLKEKNESKRALQTALSLNANGQFVGEAKKVLTELK